MPALHLNRAGKHLLGLTLLAYGGFELGIEDAAEFSVIVSPEEGLAPLHLSNDTEVVDSFPAGTKTCLLGVRFAVPHHIRVYRHILDLLLNVKRDLLEHYPAPLLLSTGDIARHDVGFSRGTLVSSYDLDHFLEVWHQIPPDYPIQTIRGGIAIGVVV